jgi:hypothetical protein
MLTFGASVQVAIRRRILSKPRCRPISFAKNANAMQRLLQCFAVVALATFCLGCPMPQTGLDYCAPTVDANGVPTGGFNMRQGSVLGGMPGVPVYAQQQPTPAKVNGVPTPAAPPDASGTPTAAAEGSKAQPVSATMPVTADPDTAELAE